MNHPQIPSNPIQFHSLCLIQNVQCLFRILVDHLQFSIELTNPQVKINQA